ncbi:MAG TPA: GHMP kinase [Verrucomicrobiota bacterium]|nr:GHMP kinase [Verrucomicrobiota bacterium]HNU52579.1 GHMP kinase [Verrucomicrobiota bacterium]
MIISQTPLRMSFVGGGSDLPAYFREHGGAVVSTAIDKYVYVTVNPKFDRRIRVSYSRTENVAWVSRLKHPLVREALRMLDVEGGVEIVSVADIPSRGTGLGSSSAFTVGLLNALHAYCGERRTAEALAREACTIEIDRCGEPIGWQDQYAAAYGGLNYIEFCPGDRVHVNPIRCRANTLKVLQAHLVMFYTGLTRRAGPILEKKQEAIAGDRRKRAMLARMVGLAGDLRAELERDRVGAVGEILHENWMLKRRLARGVSSARIDGWYRAARRAGAVGGKILGAGAGGFLLFVAEPGRHEAIERALGGLRRVPVGFEAEGTRVIRLNAVGG